MLEHFDQNYPPTPRSWIDVRLDGTEDDYAEVRGWVMRMYADPLRTFLKHSSYRRLREEPDDLIHGFFARRLATPENLQDWSRRRPRPRLHQWIQTGFSLYVKGRIRDDRRLEQRFVEMDGEHELAVDGDTPERAMMRKYVEQLVRECLRELQEECGERMPSHLAVFHLRLSGRRWAEIAEECPGFTTEQCRRMWRTMRDRYCGILRDALLREGVPASEIEQEIRRLLEF